MAPRILQSAYRCEIVSAIAQQVGVTGTRLHRQAHFSTAELLLGLCAAVGGAGHILLLAAETQGARRLDPATAEATVSDLVAHAFGAVSTEEIGDAGPLPVEIEAHR